MPDPDDLSLSTALERLYRRNLHAIKLDLDPIRAVLGELGDPQDQMLTVHVAGTNGKGTVTAMMGAMLAGAGLSTGLYTSPHLIRFHERLRLNGRCVTDRDLLALMDEVEAAVVAAVGRGVRDLTFFEFTTAMAFLWFHREGAHAAAIETGMGGRLDATNVVVPAVSVITSIGLEHTRYLGDTVAAIAGEKAGIIKEGRPVVVGDLPEDAMAVMVRTAREREARLVRASELVSVKRRQVDAGGQTLTLTAESGEQGSVTIPFLGPHPAANAGLAAAAGLVLRDEVGLPLSWEEILGGISSARMPARTQVISRRPPVVVDGAHNPPAAAVLAKSMAEVWRDAPLGVVAGFLDDKQPADFMRYFKARLHACWAVPVPSERTLLPEDICRDLASTGIEAVPMVNLTAAFLAAWRWANEENGVILVTGSFYLAGEFLASLADGRLAETGLSAPGIEA